MRLPETDPRRERPHGRVPTRTLGYALSAAAGAILTATVLGAGLVTAADPNSDTYRQLNLFGEVFERVRADYVEKVEDSVLIEAAIGGMLTSLDPHSSYMNAKKFEDMQVQTKGEFGGLGIEVTLENGFVKVVSPIDDTPAFRAGMQPGDIITHLNGENVVGLSLEEAVERMRGAPNTSLTITVRREGRDPFDVTIVRDIIRIQSVRHRNEDGIGYIRVTTFNEQAQSGIDEAMNDLRAELGNKLRGIVLDLRNNPGGLLEQAVSISDSFLEKGEIVSTRGRKPEDAQRFNARPGDLAQGLPMVVLINGGSASASEIVAGALQDHRRAILLGTKTFGKGSVQTIVPLPQHGAMRLTTARYYTPSGNSIQAMGITPDIRVTAARIEALDNGPMRREADLRGALKNENGNGTPAAQPGDDGAPVAGEEAADEADRGESDYQLSRALDLLKGITLYKTRVTN
ncbi:MAG: S41 family peptidase [Alphaproteobacteria bacterium]